MQAPPVYIQEKVHPKVLIDDLARYGGTGGESSSEQIDLFADFNGLPEGTAGTEFYQHDTNWSNRMILGDSLQGMASLAEREGLRGKVQCIYIDPPYGIKFNSNFQWVHDQPQREGRQGRAHHAGAGAGQGVPRYVAGRCPFVPHVSAGSVDGGAGSADRQRLRLRADW